MGAQPQTAHLRVSQLFERSKRMCFGRYALELPQESEQVLGYQSIDAGFKRYEASSFANAVALLEARWRETVASDSSAEALCAITAGPVPNASYRWYYEADYDKEDDVRMLDGAIALGARLYLYEGMAAKTEKLVPEDVFARMTALMRGMRAWNGVEVPREPGVCIDGAFIHEPTNRFQEIMSSGFYFPSLPDVSFSVSSNKSASTVGPNGRGLLDSVEEARSNPALALVGGYPYTFLRKGKRTLHGLWDGEEVLTRSTRDQALRFEWGMVGQTGNPARPAHLEARMSTRVAHNRVGASSTTSLSDDEAVALWDHLLENVKFRVAVPGATPQSVAIR